MPNTWSFNGFQLNGGFVAYTVTTPVNVYIQKIGVKSDTPALLVEQGVLTIELNEKTSCKSVRSAEREIKESWKHSQISDLSRFDPADLSVQVTVGRSGHDDEHIGDRLRGLLVFDQPKYEYSINRVTSR